MANIWISLVTAKKKDKKKRYLKRITDIWPQNPTTKASLVNTSVWNFTTTDGTDYTAAFPRDFII